METEPVATCPVCDSPRREVLHDRLIDRLYGAPGRWRLQRCSGCEAAYLDPRPTRKSMASAYEAYYTHEPAAPRTEAGALRRLRAALRNGYLNARYGYVLRPATPLGRVVVPLLPGPRAAADRRVRGLERPRDGASILDVGCGNGEFLLEMRAAGWTAHGLETDPRAAASARERSLDVREGTLEQGAYAPDSFDAVTLSHVVEHLHDPVATLRTACRILRPDGVLWIATPNLVSRGHARYGRSWRGLEPPRHLVLFTPSALTRALDRAGFRVGSFQRPASAGWVYEASDGLSRDAVRASTGDRLRLRLASAATDLRTRFDHRRGEELVVLARPA